MPGNYHLWVMFVLHLILLNSVVTVLSCIWDVHKCLVYLHVNGVNAKLTVKNYHTYVHYNFCEYVMFCNFSVNPELSDVSFVSFQFYKKVFQENKDISPFNFIQASAFLLALVGHLSICEDRILSVCTQDDRKSFCTSKGSSLSSSDECQPLNTALL